MAGAKMKELVEMLTNHLLDVLITIQIAVQAWMLREIVALKVRVAGLPCHPDAATGDCKHDKKKREKRFVLFVLLVLLCFAAVALFTGCASHTFKDYDSLVKPSAVKRLQSGEPTESVYLSIRQYSVSNGVINLITVSNALPSGMYWLWHDSYGFWQPHQEFIATNTARSIPHVLQVANSNVFQARYFAVGGTNLVPPYSFAFPVVFDPPPSGTNDPPIPP